MLNNLFTKLKNKVLLKKIGQSFTEYAIILGLLGILVGYGTTQLYEASRHNFYYGLLSTNQQNIELPEGPHGVHGNYDANLVGKVELVCEIANVEDPTADIITYYAEPGQNVYCYDNSVNALRNNWSKKYMEFSLLPGEERELTLTIWDTYGISYTDKAIIKTIARSESNPDAMVKPIANIVLNPQESRYGNGSVINVSSAGSLGMNKDKASISLYQWRIVDVYLAEDGVTKLTRTEDLVAYDESIKHAENITIKIVGEPNIDLRARGLTSELGSTPKSNRYVRLRVQSNGVWSDWTQKIINTTANDVPIPVITTNLTGDGSEELTVLLDTNFKMGNALSYDPDYAQPPEGADPYDRTTYGNGILSFQWRYYKQNAAGTYELVKEYAEKEYPTNANSEFKFTEMGQYCFSLRVVDMDGIWSDWEDPNNPPPATSALKFFIVGMENMIPDIKTLKTSPSRTDGVISLNAENNTTVYVTPNIYHPETKEKNYQKKFKTTDYTNGEIYWEIRKDSSPDTIWKKISPSDINKYGKITLPQFTEYGTYTFKLKIKDASGLWSDDNDPEAIIKIKVKAKGNPINFSYTGGIQKYEANPGEYILEVWGAEGGGAFGSDSNGWVFASEIEPGGKGAYATGIIKIEQKTTLHIVVGGKGDGAIAPKYNNMGTSVKGGYNGGGAGSYVSFTQYNITSKQLGGGGGGATHIATKTGVLSSLSNSQDTVLIVAGGGGGASGSGAYGATDQNTYQYSKSSYGGIGAQEYYDNAGLPIIDVLSSPPSGSGKSSTTKQATAGTFGQGGNAGASSGYSHHGNYSHWGHLQPGGGGGGYYGGGGGGAGFVSGTGSTSPGYYFGGGGGGGSSYAKATLTNRQTISASSSMPDPEGTDKVYGRVGNGYARITPIYQ